MGLLSPEHRSILILKEMDDLPYDEIAVILGIPVGTVRSRLFRARRLLQEQLTAYAEDLGITGRSTPQEARRV